MRYHAIVRTLFSILVYVFAALGLFLTLGYAAVRMGLTDEAGIIDVQREAFIGTSTIPAIPQPAAVGTAVSPATSWQSSQEWQVMEEAIRRDAQVIHRAAADAGVPARLIVANLVSEQLRLFFTQREAYKKWFYPLKILGPQSQFSWGVMGMKEHTAIAVERHLTDPTSVFYLGSEYENRLAFSTTNSSSERFTRMTDQYDHYWSYLYAGLYLKQILVQWERAGFPIHDRADIVSTLYNIGFDKSVPKADPQVGGAAISLPGGTRSFGGLAGEFYTSDLLIDIFPR